jgi:preprotein translocase subunit YajC
MGQLILLCHVFGIRMLLAQTQVAEGIADAAEKAVADKPPGFWDSMGFMLPAMIAVTVLYLIMMGKPQDRGQTKAADMLAKLKKNDRVVTAGGILGTVVNVRSDNDYVTIRVDDSTNARMQVLASSIARVLSDDDSKQSA